MIGRPASPSLADADRPALPAGTGFSCRDCGSPAVLLPRDLSGQALVICDRCQSPIATLAAFREYVDRLAAGAQCCDHHLTICQMDAGRPVSSTGGSVFNEEIID